MVDIMQWNDEVFNKKTRLSIYFPKNVEHYLLTPLSLSTNSSQCPKGVGV
jgi:hypothetical protein